MRCIHFNFFVVYKERYHGFSDEENKDVDYLSEEDQNDVLDLNLKSETDEDDDQAAKANESDEPNESSELGDQDTNEELDDDDDDESESWEENEDEDHLSSWGHHKSTYYDADGQETSDEEGRILYI
jgi:hypothetical protein